MINRYQTTVYGREHNLLLLPVLSLSNPSKNNTRRLIFDWGKSISHPKANIAFAFVKGSHILFLVYNNRMYTIDNIVKCRSGRSI